MKKFLIITVLMSLTLTFVFAQETQVEVNMDKFEQKMEKFAEEMEDLAEKLSEEENPLVITVTSNNSGRVYMGVFPKDLTLEDVRELNYDLTYGVLISGVVTGSSASRQKIFANDIIYEIDGRKVTNNKAFTEILKSYNPGDVAMMKIFSAGKHIEKEYTFEAKPKSKEDITVDIETKKDVVDWNSIAINWIPRYYQMDEIDDINELFTGMQFDDLDEDGIFMNGFGFRIHVGSGFYLGGEWSWHEAEQTKNIQIATDALGAYPGNNSDHNFLKSKENFVRQLKYYNGFAGVTLDKRIYFTKYFQPGIGFLLGGGTHKVEFSQTNGDYDWTDLDNEFTQSGNNHMVMNRDYVIFQPRADLYIPILSWVGVRAEAAYLIGYTPYSGWKSGDYEYGIINSPDTKCTGLTFSVGPWIEF